MRWSDWIYSNTSSRCLIISSDKNLFHLVRKTLSVAGLSPPSTPFISQNKDLQSLKLFLSFISELPAQKLPAGYFLQLLSFSSNLMSDNIAENNVGEVGAVSNNEKYQYPVLAPYPYYAASNTNNYIPPPSYVETLIRITHHRTPLWILKYKYLTRPVGFLRSFVAICDLLRYAYYRQNVVGDTIGG